MVHFTAFWSTFYSKIECRDYVLKAVFSKLSEATTPYSNNCSPITPAPTPPQISMSCMDAVVIFVLKVIVNLHASNEPPKSVSDHKCTLMTLD